MFIDKRPTGLKITIALALLNAIISLIHFILLGNGILLRVSGLVSNLWIYATVTTVVAVLPVTLGAFGLYHRRMWGLGFFTLGNGAYLCLALLVLLLTVIAHNIGIMFYVSVYLVLYSFFATSYVWVFRHHFREF